MPPKHPVLALSDWEGPAPKEPTLKAGFVCWPDAPIFAYKVYNSTIYVDHDHHKDNRYKKYREAFLEMLMLSIWLYIDFPDIDLVADFSDHPQVCNHQGPFLKFSIFNKTVLDARYNLTELLAPGWVKTDQQQAASGQLQWTQGFTMPNPEAWLDFSLTKQQLLDFCACMDSTHPWSSKTPTIFWRGQATGCSRGWPMQPASKNPSGNADVAMQSTALPAAAAQDIREMGAARGVPQRKGSRIRTRAYQAHHRQGGKLRSGPQRFSQLGSGEGLAAQQIAPSGTFATQQKLASTQQPHLLRNKRVQLALMSFPYSYLDVKVTSLPQLTPDCLGARPETSKAAEFAAVARVIHGEGIGMEGWSEHRASLSVDGYGPAYRLPQQLLAGQVVLRMQSPYQSWFEHHLTAGVHMFEFDYDLSNFLLRAGELRRGLLVEPHIYKLVSEQARAVAIDVLDVFAQLDSFAWSIARIKELQSGVPVELPPDGGWQVLQLLPSDILNSKGFPADVLADVMEVQRRNLIRTPQG
jgi:hypothetical protein